MPPFIHVPQLVPGRPNAERKRAMKSLQQDLADFETMLREPLDRISASKIFFALYDARAIVSNERLVDIETDVYLLRSSKTSKRPPYARDVARMLSDATTWSRATAIISKGTFAWKPWN